MSWPQATWWCLNGGANAGHTIVVEGEKLALHLMPSAVLNPNCELVIANGTVIDSILVEEIDLVESRGLSLEGRLHVSSRPMLSALAQFARWCGRSKAL